MAQQVRGLVMQDKMLVMDTDTGELSEVPVRDNSAGKRIRVHLSKAKPDRAANRKANKLARKQRKHNRG